MGWRIGTSGGVQVDVLPRGATVQSLWFTDAAGVRRDVVLGYADEAGYASDTHFVGATIGRYANRIAEGRLDVEGVTHRLARNDRGHHLHGGPGGFHTRTWDLVRHDPGRLRLALRSPDGDEGYPGEVRAQVTFEVVGDTVTVEHLAHVSAPTVVNLTNHAYFRLGGDVEGGDVLDHELMVAASRYTPVDALGIPRGDDVPVDGTALDLRSPTRLGRAVAAGGGIDHYYVAEGVGLRTVARLRGHGLEVELASDQPGLQVYTGNAFDGATRSRAGHRLGVHAGVALEPQLPPDSPHRPVLGSGLVRPGETYRHVLRWALRRS